MSRNPDKDNAISDKAVCESIYSQAGLLLMVLYATIGASGSERWFLRFYFPWFPCFQCEIKLVRFV